MCPWDYKDWYKENKKKLSKKRKRRYRDDRQYREECKKRARGYYNSNKKMMQPKDRFRIRSADNKIYFTIGRVASMINRTIGRIREYHKSGMIPQPLYFDRRGWRLYTMKQVTLMQDAFEGVDRGGWSWEALKKYLEDNWEDGDGEEDSNG